jgi:hypothetical protein
VPGSVEIKRSFSALNFIKHRLRNRLTTGLVPALRVFLSGKAYSFSTFPFEEVKQKWEESARRYV